MAVTRSPISPVLGFIACVAIGHVSTGRDRQSQTRYIQEVTVFDLSLTLGGQLWFTYSAQRK